MFDVILGPVTAREDWTLAVMSLCPIVDVDLNM